MAEREKRNKKGIVIASVAGVAVITTAVLLSRKAEGVPELPPDAVPGGDIVIQILDDEGNLVPTNSPAVLTEGSKYTIRVSVKNNTTRAGVPYAAQLETCMGVIAGGADLIPVTCRSDGFSPEETKAFTWTLNVPDFSGGQSGQITASVLSPSGLNIANAVEYFTILTIDIVYGATVVIGV